MKKLLIILGIAYLLATAALQLTDGHIIYYLFAEEKDDKKAIAQLRKDIKKYEPGSPYQKLSYFELANIYASPQSEFYEPEEARQYHFRSYLNEFSTIPVTKKCINHFSTIPDSLITNDIHVSVLSDFVYFCGLSDNELFAIAEDFETEGKRYFIDPLLALMIYKHIESKQRNTWLNAGTPSSPIVEKRIDGKIKLLEGTL